jgi:mannosidase alpha-like ER degradation enhancer 2
MRRRVEATGMKTTTLKLIGLLLIAILSAPFVRSQQPVNKSQLENQVRAEFLHAWNGYKKYAWGHDDLKPLSKSFHDWHAEPLLMTPVDALDTMMLMDLKDEARATREYIATHLSFDKDFDVQNFEITIRLLGGLLSSYQLSGDKRLLNLAEDLGTRLLPVFTSPTGIPYRVNLKTGKVRGNVTNPAEAGTLLIEFGTLSKLTHKPIFYERAKRALVEIYKRRSAIGLVGTWINVDSGQWTDADSHISGAIDSYYEYLLKCAILFDDQDCRRMWNESIVAINQYLRDETKGRMKPELWYGHADMNTGQRTGTTFGALDTFFPAVLALSGDLNRASLLQESSYKMWMKNSIEPEEFNYQTMEVVSPGYPLRPEIVESTYYLYHYALLRARTARPHSSFRRGTRPSQAAQVPPLNGTGNKLDATHYQQMGEMMFRDFVKYCRTEEGYAALKSVVTKEKADSMQSFLFAETFKYFYLLFAPPRTLNFEKVIFNTEAHPVRRMR